MKNKFEDFFKNKKEVSFLKKVKENFRKKEPKENERKLNLEKVRDVGLLITAVTLIGIGYVNFSKNPQANANTVETYADSVNKLGDVELVNSEAVLVENSKNDNSTGLVENEKPQETSTSNSSKTYFAELRMNRDNVYSQSLETYQKIIDSSTISNEQKSIAVQEIEKINKSKKSIAVAEELIKLKGFEEVVIYEGENSVSVVVRISALSLEQVAQIQNIVSRELGVASNTINISNK